MISWNEWSENTYIEPGERYRNQEITTLRSYLRGRDGAGTAVSRASPAGPAQGGWSGLRAAALLFVITVVGLVVLVRYAGRRAPAAHHAQALLTRSQRSSAPVTACSRSVSSRAACSSARACTRPAGPR